MRRGEEVHPPKPATSWHLWVFRFVNIILSLLSLLPCMLKKGTHYFGLQDSLFNILNLWRCIQLWPVLQSKPTLSYSYPAQTFPISASNQTRSRLLSPLWWYDQSPGKLQIWKDTKDRNLPPTKNPCYRQLVVPSVFCSFVNYKGVQFNLCPI